MPDGAAVHMHDEGVWSISRWTYEPALDFKPVGSVPRVPFDRNAFRHLRKAKIEGATGRVCATSNCGDFRSSVEALSDNCDIALTSDSRYRGVSTTRGNVPAVPDLIEP